MSVDGYEIFWSVRSDGKKQEGVALCINRKLRDTQRMAANQREAAIFQVRAYQRKPHNICVLRSNQEYHR